MPTANRVLLVLGGTLAAILSLAILFSPAAFYASYGIEVDGMANLLNELKAPALVILALGAIQALGAFQLRHHRLGIGAGVLLYLGFGLSRLAAMATDGPPAAALIAVTASELVIGFLFVLALWRLRTSTAG
ncbi:MAG: DUF4345 domain-containing protein [Parvibaculum sp.]|uniref:DUF4345 domain-containing protein n=1 Tax=Parvibaculum sp. TaxID=2024848 RepID=UPI0032EF0A14